MKGAYNTTPETSAIKSKKPMRPRKIIPGKPANRSTCRLSMKCITPPSSAGSATTAPVRASTATCFKPSSRCAALDKVTYHTRSSSMSWDTNMPTLSGYCAIAMSMTRSRLMRGWSAGSSSGSSAGSTSAPVRCAISCSKIRGKPVSPKINMNTVHTRLVHLCSHTQVRMDCLVMT